jgi:hypothetical protein
MEISAAKPPESVKAASEALLGHVSNKLGPASTHWQKAGLVAEWFGGAKAAHGKLSAQDQARLAQEEAKKKADDERRAELLVSPGQGCRGGGAGQGQGCGPFDDRMS